MPGEELPALNFSRVETRRTRTDVLPGIVEKALGNARTGTKKKGTELCAMYVEVENGAEGVTVCSDGLSNLFDLALMSTPVIQTDVLVGLDSKQPKVVAGTVGCLKDLIEYTAVTLIFAGC